MYAISELLSMKLPQTGCHAVKINQSYLKVKLMIVVESDKKAPFSSATTPRCSGERNSFLRIAPLYL